MTQKISREEEANLPAFDSHEEAKVYFKEKYGEHFVFESSDLFSNGMMYFYALVFDHESYRRGRNELTAGRSFSDRGFLNSYQSIQIGKDGSIHIVH